MGFPLSNKYETSNAVTVHNIESDKKAQDVESEKSQDIITAEPYSSNDDAKNKSSSFWSRFRFSVDTSDHPPQIFNKTLYLSIFVFGILGAGRGLDEGNISGNIALPAFKQRFGLSDKSKSADELANLKSNITSMVQLGSIGGAIIAMKSVDYFGRIRALQLTCILWIVGVIIEITSSSVGQ
ncbi:hypothetical protein KGF57_004349, partial [Candida theae]